MTAKNPILISPSLSLPMTFLTSTQGILAKKRRGKSYTAQVQAEELLRLKQQIVVLDPTGAWYGLRSSADGKRAGYPIVVFGGDHADVPLEATGGETLASAIVNEGFSARLNGTRRLNGAAADRVYQTLRAHLLVVGRFSCFEATASLRAAHLFQRLHEDPDLEITNLGYPWTGVRLR